MGRAKKLSQTQLQMLADIVAGELFVVHSFGAAPYYIARKRSIGPAYRLSTFDALRRLDLVRPLARKWSNDETTLRATPVGRAIIMQMMGDMANELENNDEH